MVGRSSHTRLSFSGLVRLETIIRTSHSDRRATSSVAHNTTLLARLLSAPFVTAGEVREEEGTSQAAVAMTDNSLE
jgi:hypothetical protein